MRRVQSVLRSEAGVALVMALLTVVVLLLVGAGLVTAAMTEVFTAQVAEDSGRALNVAEAGLAHAIQVLRQDPNWLDNQGATAGCDVGSPFGENWKVLRNLGNDENPCMSQVPYPQGAAIPVSQPSSTPGQQAECASDPVEVGSGGGGSGPEPAAIGSYTVYFNVSEGRSVNTLRVRVVGKVGRAQRGVEADLARVTPGDFVAYSASTVDSSVRSGSGIMSIHGSVYIRGDWVFKGNTGQYNDRPITTEDASEPPYENQTYICGDLRMIGSAQIGEPGRPMKAVHVAGDGLDSTRIYANRKDNAVPEIRLADVRQFILCVGGLNSNEYCIEKFGQSVWGSHTNELNSRREMSVVVWDGTRNRFTEGSQPDITFSSNTGAFLLPRKDRQNDCVRVANENLNSDGSLKAGGSRAAVLEECVLFFDKSATPRRIYVAGRQQVDGRETNQVIYVPGRVVFDTDVQYVVDSDPDVPRANDTAVIVIACEGCPVGTEALHVKRGAKILARNRGSRNLDFAKTDLLAFLVNGVTRLEGQGQASRDCSDPSEQEQNAVFVTGGEPGEIYTKFRLQLFGALIAKKLVLQDDREGSGQAYNVRWCQVPDLGELVGPTLLGRFLNNPASSTVVIKKWREIGF